MNIYSFFASYTKLPVRLSDIKDFILEREVVSEIIRYPIVTNPSVLQGGFHLFRDLAPPYQERPLIARIGYPANADEPVQRLITVKEMLHVFDPQDATSPTKSDVEGLICDLLVQEAEKEIGMAAKVDHTKLLNALCILMPRDALDELRPVYKRGRISVEQIAAEAKVPRAYAAAALTDEWRKIAERIS